MIVAFAENERTIITMFLYKNFEIQKLRSVAADYPHKINLFDASIHVSIVGKISLMGVLGVWSAKIAGKWGMVTVVFSWDYYGFFVSDVGETDDLDITDYSLFQQWLALVKLSNYVGHE